MRKANGAAAHCMAPGGAVCAGIVDDLQVQLAPGRSGKEALEISLCLHYRLAVTQAPPFGAAVDVRVDGKGAAVKGLYHDDRCGFVPHTGQRLEGSEALGHSAAIAIDKDL